MTPTTPNQNHLNIHQPENGQMSFRMILLSWEYHTAGKTHDLQLHTRPRTSSQTRAPDGALTFFSRHRIDSKQVKRISTSFRKPQIRGTPLKQGLACCLFQYAGLLGHSHTIHCVNGLLVPGSSPCRIQGNPKEKRHWQVNE